MEEPAARHSVKIIDQSRVSPPPTSVPTTSLPLTFFDFSTLLCKMVQRLLFYELSDSIPNFTAKTIPSLKTSLSLALEKFYPYAANLIWPPPPDVPHILYTDGDSVPFIVAVSTADFHELTSNSAQDVKLLRPLVPPLPPLQVSDDTGTMLPLVAIQVTLFPNSGICIGVQYSHVVADGRSFSHFMKSWASICRTGHIQMPLPSHDRDIIKDPNNVKTILLKDWLDLRSSRDAFPPRPHADVRATFNMCKADIDRLKGWIKNQFTKLGDGKESLHVSTFAAACAFTWVCLIKSREADEGEHLKLPRENSDRDNNGELCYFVFVADCRNRLESAIPETYFGNCLAVCYVSIEKRLLLGQYEYGIVLAAKDIARKIKELENGGALRGAEKWISDILEIFRLGMPVSVAGSPRLTVYDIDFGWGRPRKSAVVHIDEAGSISLAETRDEEGGLEIGVALGKASMDAFTRLFEQGLKLFSN